MSVKEAKCHICEKTFNTAHKRNVHRAKAHGITQMIMKNQAMVSKAELSEPDEEWKFHIFFEEMKTIEIKMLASFEDMLSLYVI